MSELGAVKSDASPSLSTLVYILGNRQARLTNAESQLVHMRRLVDQATEDVKAALAAMGPTNAAKEGQPEDTSEATKEEEVLARVLCLEECRAGLCVDGQKCFNTWPGNGSGSQFGPYLKLARDKLRHK